MPLTEMEVETLKAVAHGVGFGRSHDAILSALAEIDRLRTALEVFAAVADQYDNAHRTRAQRFKEEGSALPAPKDYEYVNLVTLGDCRKARAALRTEILLGE